jgi:hypothetical protein
MKNKKLEDEVNKALRIAYNKGYAVGFDQQLSYSDLAYILEPAISRCIPTFMLDAYNKGTVAGLKERMRTRKAANLAVTRGLFAGRSFELLKKGELGLVAKHDLQSAESCAPCYDTSLS